MDASDLIAAAKACLAAGDMERLRGLVNRHPEVLDLRTKDDDSLNLLHLAAKNGAAAHVRMLLDVGADSADRGGKWVADELPEGGYYEPGWTAMMLAARGGHSGIVKMLIEAYGGRIWADDRVTGQPEQGAVIRFTLKKG